MSRAKVYGLLMALAMLFMAGLCACSAQPHSAAETAPQTIVVGIDVFDPYSYLDRNGQFAGIDVELATEAFSRLGYTPEFRTISWPDKDNLLSDGTIDCIWSCFSMNGRETKYQWAGPYMSELRDALTHKVVSGRQPLLPKHGDYMGKKVLLVEDNELNREIATAILEEAGLKVDAVEDGTDAVAKMNEAAEDEYDLILMDIQMPKMDGYTATREIRTLSSNKKANIPIVAMTANAFEEDRQKAFKAGMNAHIAKPIDVNILMGTLDKVFKQNS